MSTSRSMTPITVVMERLQEKGYGRELTIAKDGAYFEGEPKMYTPSQLTIVKVYRFEGESDPADMAVIYAIQADDGQVGYLLNAYGTYSDQDNPYYDGFIRNVPMEEREDL
ncbi:hypothetical protein [Parapedobacter koreensis]|uniref:Phosphoribosylpyrophosphate synthetase n=1 Tax=Parapedobacter koreensis TaxID=332977 RepID=A0A1H7MJD9_9SPHI|nr:hypothetical protein [Parapedobacter koreensis]SEL11189.1 hypothetical protein SAMN05421740_103539 [Parapedobacter koreensis]